MRIKTRFAPSPTGYLHVGGARTALFSWLYARNKQGKFILRVEDTDLERSTEISTTNILNGLKWLGLDWDEEPTLQSARIHRYQEILNDMVDKKLAYYCDCSKSRLSSLREQQLAEKIKPKYDNKCRERNLKSSDNTVIRFSNPLNGKVIFDDLVFGKISVDNSELDDLVLQRSDGMPTYNFAAAIDDYDMEITHVIRGDDHINNTPKQINILEALAFQVPKFAHLPMILNEDGKRMSKRHDAVNVMQYREEGILPEALLNYLVRLGWSHNDQEIFSINEMIKLFDLANVNKASATFSKDKLLWINKNYIQNFENINYINELEDIIKQIGADIKLGPPLHKILPFFAKRSETLIDFAKDCLFLYTDKIEYNSPSVSRFFTNGIQTSMNKVVDMLEGAQGWSLEEISQIIKSVIKMDSLKFPQLAQPIRIALTGDTNSPGIAEVIFLVGKERTVARINAAIRLNS